MQKVYLLLRNNHQTGPFTLEELVQQKIRPADLVWIEGKSQAWSYPSEIKELKTSSCFSELVETTGHPLHSSTSPTADDIEQRAEELRQRVLSFAPASFPQINFVRDKVYTDALNSIEKDSIDFVDHRKKEVPALEWISGVAVTLIVAGGVYGGQKYFSAGSNLLPASTQSVAVDNHAAKVVIRPNIQTALANYKEAHPDTAVLAVVEIKKPDKPFKKRKVADALPAKRIVTPREETAAAVARIFVDEPIKEEALQVEPKPIVSIEPIEKKKSLGQVLKGLFKKKKKQDEKPEDVDGSKRAG
jgi:hypothetical protein